MVTVMSEGKETRGTPDVDGAVGGRDRQRDTCRQEVMYGQGGAVVYKQVPHQLPTR